MRSRSRRIGIPDTHLQIHSPVVRSFRANPGPPVISNTLRAWPTLPEGGCLTSQSAGSAEESLDIIFGDERRAA